MRIKLKVLVLIWSLGLCNLTHAYDSYHHYKVANYHNPGLYKFLPGAGLMQADLGSWVGRGGAVLSNADLRGVNLMRSCAVGVNFSASNLSPLPASELEKIAQREELGRQCFAIRHALAQVEKDLQSYWLDEVGYDQLINQKHDLISKRAKLLGLVLPVAGETFLERVKRTRTVSTKLQGFAKSTVEVELRPERVSNLCQADLRSAKFFTANLTKVNLSGAKLSGANFYGAKLAEANLEGVEVWDQKYGSADFRGARGLGLGQKKFLWIKGALVDLTPEDRKRYAKDPSHLKPTQQALVRGELD